MIRSTYELSIAQSGVRFTSTQSPANIQGKSLQRNKINLKRNKRQRNKKSAVAKSDKQFFTLLSFILYCLYFVSQLFHFLPSTCYLSFHYFLFVEITRNKTGFYHYECLLFEKNLSSSWFLFSRFYFIILF